MFVAQALERHPTPKASKRSAKQLAAPAAVPLPKGRKGVQLCLPGMQCCTLTSNIPRGTGPSQAGASLAAALTDAGCVVGMSHFMLMEESLTRQQLLAVQTESRGRRCGNTCTRCSCRSTWTTCAPRSSSCRPRVRRGCRRLAQWSPSYFCRSRHPADTRSILACEKLLTLRTAALMHLQARMGSGRRSFWQLRPPGDPGTVSAAHRVHLPLSHRVQHRRRKVSGRRLLSLLAGGRSSGMSTASSAATSAPAASPAGARRLGPRRRLPPRCAPW
jgi:hypothetical protein